MDQNPEGQPQSNLPREPEVNFQSSDIKNTKSAKPSEYFVQIKDSPESRRKRSESRRAQRREERRAKCEALKARHRAKSLSRRQYLKEWFKIYRAPIAIIFLTGTAIAIIIGIIIVITWPQPEECPATPTYSSEEFQEIISQITEPTDSSDNPESPADANSSDNPDELLDVCNEQINIATDPKDKAEAYLVCADQINLNYGEKEASLILEYAYRAEELAPSVLTAQAVASYEGSYGSTEKALEYQNIALERMGETPGSPDEPEYRAETLKSFEEGGGV